MKASVTLAVKGSNEILCRFMTQKPEAWNGSRNKRAHLVAFRESGGTSRRTALTRLREVGDDAVIITIEVYDGDVLVSVMHPQ
jgi:hypothetical protein